MARYKPAVICCAAFVMSVGCRPPSPTREAHVITESSPATARIDASVSREADMCDLELTMCFIDTAQAHPTCEVRLQNVGPLPLHLSDRSDGEHLGVKLELADDGGGMAELTPLGESQFMAITGTFLPGFDFKSGERLVWRVVLSDSFRLKADHGYTVSAYYGVNSRQWAGDIGVRGLHFRTLPRDGMKNGAIVR